MLLFYINSILMFYPKICFRKQDSVSGAGDINGDGFYDLIIGAPELGDGTGKSYVIFGHANGIQVDSATHFNSLDGTNGFRIDTINEYDELGYSVSGAGDVNGDGYDDLVVANRKYNGYVLFGHGGVWNSEIDVTELNGYNGFRIDLTYIDVGFTGKIVVSNAGDVNGDGIGDLIIGSTEGGAPRNVTPISRGGSYVLFGHTGYWEPVMDLFTLDGNNGFFIAGNNMSLPGTVSAAGDVNGDGYADLLIGYDNEFSLIGETTYGQVGAAHLVYGRPDGWDAIFELGNTFSGNDSNKLKATVRTDQLGGTYFGQSVSGIGDFNGDGFDDLIIGEPGRQKSYTDGISRNEGSAYVYFGSVDFDGSGFRIDGVDNTVSSVLGTSVSGVGDYNGDGFDDLIIGAPGARAVYLLYGGSNGWSSATLIGDNGDNSLVGTGVTDYIIAGDGSDTVTGGGGPDVLYGGRGNDTLIVADDSFFRVDGGNGEDTLKANFSFDLSTNALSKKIRNIEKIDLVGGIGSVVTIGTRQLLEILDGNKQLTIEGDSEDIVELEGGWVYQNSSNGYQYYTAEDAHLDLYINVGTVYLVPLIKDTEITVYVDTVYPGTLYADFVGAANYQVLTPPSHGDVQIHSSTMGGYTYTPESEFDGTDSFTYQVNFGDTYSKVATVAITLSQQLSMINLSNLDGHNGFRMDGKPGDAIGNAVSNAGDVNGDGYEDLIVGASAADSRRGAAYVVFGKPVAGDAWDGILNLDRLDGSNGFRLNGINAGRGYYDPGGSFVGDQAGSSVSGAGDVNGDGYGDLIIGAPSASNNQEGESYVVFGRPSWYKLVELSSLDGSNGFIISGKAGDDLFGTSVSGAGDVNNDGYDDLIIGAPYTGDPVYWSANEFGTSYVLFGHNDGWESFFSLTDLNGENGFWVGGDNNHDRNGISVSNGGDINGDGVEDLIVGTDGGDGIDGDSKGDVGETYVVFGSSGSWSQNINLSVLDGSNGTRIDGIHDNGWSGWSVSVAGDVNGDGYGDLIIGATKVDSNGKTDSGESYVVFGKSNWDAITDLSILDGSNGFILQGENDGDLSGISVSGGGDVNGDGYDDILIGAAHADPNGNDNAGVSYVVFGKGGSWEEVLSLGSLSGNAVFSISGYAGENGLSSTEVQQKSGTSVSMAGDLNGDGFDDIVIGAPSSTHIGEGLTNGSGSSYVLFGGLNGWSSATIPGGMNDDYLFGSASADNIISGDGSDTLIGNGGADVLYGGRGNDVLSISDETFLRIDGGRGIDTLKMPFTMDLTALNSKQIRNIERIDLSGGASNIILLSEINLLEITGENNTLHIDGDAADNVRLSDKFMSQGTVGKYEHFTVNDVHLNLYVSTALTKLLESDIDSDSDGVVDRLDAFPGNSLYSHDTDNDGLPDAWETNRIGNLNSSGDSDNDNDGFTNLEEFTVGHDPVISTIGFTKHEIDALYTLAGNSDEFTEIDRVREECLDDPFFCGMISDATDQILENVIYRAAVVGAALSFEIAAVMCTDDPASCGIDEGFSSIDLETAILDATQAAINSCVEDPAICGITGDIGVSSYMISEGWSLIGGKNAINTAQIQSFIDEYSISSVWGWQEGYWRSYIDGVPVFLNTLADMKPEQGYFVYRQTQQ